MSIREDLWLKLHILQIFFTVYSNADLIVIPFDWCKLINIPFLKKVAISTLNECFIIERNIKMVLILCIENSKNVRIRLQLITNLQNELVDPLILNTVYIVIVQFWAEHKNNPLLKNMLFKHWKMHSLKKTWLKVGQKVSSRYNTYILESDNTSFFFSIPEW